jgi:hypothetical protein
MSCGSRSGRFGRFIHNRQNLIAQHGAADVGYPLIVLNSEPHLDAEPVDHHSFGIIVVVVD